MPSSLRWSGGPVAGLVLVALLASGFRPGMKEEQDQRSKQAQEEQDYFKKWLNEDVVYVITNEERSVFEKLNTPAEKERFIEQFWVRRDPSPGTSYNDFKEEHYRRIKYSNERYAAGFPGWMSDRGKIYIKFGPPDEIRSSPSGGMHTREFYEGGGQAVTYPFEIWWYRHIEGLGQDIEMEFVDRLNSGEFRMAMDQWEKEVGFEMGIGPTTFEQLGLVTRAEMNRARFLGNSGNPYVHSTRIQDQPLERLSRYAQLMKPPVIRFDDLRTVVETRVRFQQIPVSVVAHVTPIHESLSLALVTAKIQVSPENYAQTGDVWRSETHIYGRLSDLTGKVVYEFDDDVVSTLGAAPSGRGLAQRLYQRKIPVKRGRFKLQFVVREVKAEKTGTLETVVVVPGPSEKLRGTMVLADRAAPVRPGESLVDPFVVTEDLKVYPSIDGQFAPSDRLGVYLEVHNLSQDMATQTADVKFRYSVVSKDGTLVADLAKELEPRRVENNSVVNAFFAFPLQTLAAGEYSFQMEVTDLISENRLLLKDNFRVEAN